ncbi:MAG TPA: hypothetical protein VFB78_17210 [Acidimicrobiales bacterium]|nr:hypothetical protein [Acidimicrobiales bacterium]
MNRARVFLGSAIVVAALIVAVALTTRSNDGRTKALTAANAASNGCEERPIVFYSGQGEAALQEGDCYSSWEFVEENHPLPPTFDDWAEGPKCSPYGADDFPSNRGLHILVGYSLGRLGPVYFLRAAPSRWGEIDTIYLLDPGPEGPMNGGCDNPDISKAERPGVYLAQWLKGDSKRALIVVSSTSHSLTPLAAFTSTT